MGRFYSVIIAVAFVIIIPRKDRAFSQEYAENVYPIIATHPFWLNRTNVATYKDVLSAGFNLAYNEYDNITGAEKFLRVADSLNTKVMVSTPELTKGDTVAFKKILGYSSLKGVVIVDEPSLKSFSEIKRVYDAYRRINDTVILQVNLHPIYANKEQLGTISYEYYVENFLGIVKPTMFSFDNYPITKSGLMPNYYKNYEIISSCSREKKIPYWGYVLCSSFNNYPIPTRGTIALQAHTNLAYGAQGIAYFTYRRTVNPKSIASPVDGRFRKTDLYYSIQQFNKELAFYSDYVLNCTILDVSHIGRKLPEGTHGIDFAKLSEIRGIRVRGAGFIVTSFTKENKKYMFLVNKNYRSRQRVIITPQKSIKRIAFEKKNNYSFKQRHSINVEPGGIILLEL